MSDYVADGGDVRWGLGEYPVELRPPERFDPEEPGTWPQVNGRLEYVGGRLLLMPPCGVLQSSVVARVVGRIMAWAEANPDFLVGTNEAGMKLGSDARGADVAVWRRRDIDPWHAWARKPPVLAVEVEGKVDGERERALRLKTLWYLDHGVKTVWLVLPSRREIIAITSGGESRHGAGAVTPEHAELPGLKVPVDAVFSGL